MDGDSERDSRCHCGHPRSAHRHYREGTECAVCLDCARYRPTDGLIRTLAVRLLRLSRS